ncbi:hypothetical protein LC613_28095 [Nostoc sphaeroides CHAB 2801]|uniref:hypothetical protein n=1 Tax=Nostoc sphaeroides TaxID=446679 RepID=UPI001C703082|nr:hypothetical protein [Nostoc sphaeroides]MCC5631599.1 hypothetical protein [Nostoc sphaeroides CHAB 2801]
MTVHDFSVNSQQSTVNSQQSTVNSQQSTTLMWNNLFFGVPLKAAKGSCCATSKLWGFEFCFLEDIF